MNETPDLRVASLEEAVGAQVRATRLSLGMTIAELAKAASLSVGMLSKIENGQTSPSLSTLQSLAGALNVPVGAFFARYDEKRDASFVKAGHGLAIDRRGSAKGHLYQLLGHGVRAPVRVEPFLITLDEGSDTFPIFRHAGVEFLYMIEGEVTYRHGDRTYRMEPGDSLFFDAEALHGPAILHRLPAIYLSIIVSPPEAADSA